MESSKILGDTEECSSSESGWTMYIASPIHEYNNYDDIDDDNNHSTDEKGDEDDDESDDSMASDASSGPIRPELPCGGGEGSHIMGHFKHAESEEHKKYSSSKKPNKQAGKKSYKQVDKKIQGRRIKEEKEKPEFNANSANSYAHTGAKRVPNCPSFSHYHSDMVIHPPTNQQVTRIRQEDFADELCICHAAKAL
ncbi:hypothetical protein F0562_033929 [Nyssa sinensis]|uniref:Uncharacterized protein n=1 Tax=Nyssa sinensis TaxID=561372 RepID=A0A5J5AHD1_9ASTE|nr:hypothetical protein F0562_033929 [Nyssa sinensis]